MAGRSISILLKAVDRTRRPFGAVAKRATALTGTLAKLSAGFAIGGAGALTIFTKNAMQAIDVMDKTSRRIGINVTQLSELEHVANLTGVQTNTMAMALQRLTRRLSESTAGYGEARGALTELSLSAEDLLALPIGEQLGVIGDRMNQLGSSAARVRLAMKLFDSEGVQMTQILEKGSAGINEMMEEARALGLSLTDLDVAKVVAANDAMTRMGGLVKGLSYQFAVEFAPFVEYAVTSLTDMAKEMGGMRSVAGEFMKSIFGPIGVLLDSFQKMRIFLAYVNVGWQAFELAALTAITTILAPLGYAIDGVNWLKEKLGMEPGGNFIFDTWRSSIETYEQSLRDLRELTEKPMPSKAFTTWIDEVMKSLDELDTKRGTITKNEVERMSFQLRMEEQMRAKALAFQQMSNTERVANVLSTNQQLFGNSKGLAIANAMMSTYVAAAKARETYPPPLGTIMAAAEIAAGLATVAKIKATSMDGGGVVSGFARSGGLDGKGGVGPFILHPGEKVLPRRESSGVVINNIIDAGNDANAEVRIASAIQASQAATIATIQNLIRRGRFV